MKDIFIDNNVALNLVTPITDPFKDFLKWLHSDGVLVLNSKLHTEYIRGNQILAVIINKLLIDGRINKIKNNHLLAFTFSKKQEKEFLSNGSDRVHLKSIFLSTRKLAISSDKNFIRDVNSFSKINGIQPTCADCPSKLAYR